VKHEYSRMQINMVNNGLNLTQNLID